MITTVAAYILAPMFALLGLFLMAIVLFVDSFRADKPDAFRVALACLFAAHVCAFMGGI